MFHHVCCYPMWVTQFLQDPIYISTSSNNKTSTLVQIRSEWCHAILRQYINMLLLFPREYGLVAFPIYVASNGYVGLPLVLLPVNGVYLAFNRFDMTCMPFLFQWNWDMCHWQFHHHQEYGCYQSVPNHVRDEQCTTWATAYHKVRIYV